MGLFIILKELPKSKFMQKSSKGLKKKVSSLFLRGVIKP